MCQVTHRLGALLTTYPPPPPPPHTHAPHARQRGHQHTRAPTPRTQGRASTHRATPQHAHTPHARAHTRTLYHTIHARAHTPCYTTTHTMPLSHTWAHARTHAHKRMDARVFSGSKPLNKQERVVTTGAWQLPTELNTHVCAWRRPTTPARVADGACWTSTANQHARVSPAWLHASPRRQRLGRGGTHHHLSLLCQTEWPPGSPDQISVCCRRCTVRGARGEGVHGE
jgi:hypothetical protein